MECHFHAAGRHPVHRADMYPVPVPPTEPRAAGGLAQGYHLRIQPRSISKIDPANVAFWVKVPYCSPVIEGALADQYFSDWSDDDSAVWAKRIAPPVSEPHRDAPDDSSSEPGPSLFLDCFLSQLGVLFNEPVN